MSVELALVMLYLAVCVGIGLFVSRRGMSSGDEYWVAGRSIGPAANAMAIMASLASGGSIIGVMGFAYKLGIPYTLSLFAGAIVGFPLAAVLVAAPLRRFGKFTLSDFLSFRYPHPVVKTAVPLFILFSFTVYMIAQMKAAGIAGEVLLGMPYRRAVTLSAVVFILYVSIGGMLAVTWTDIMQGSLMLAVVVGTAFALTLRQGDPISILNEATRAAPALGEMREVPFTSLLGIFVLWAAAVPVIPHIVMRVFTARDPRGAKISLNLAMVLYSVMILGAVFIIVPVGATVLSDIGDADKIFLEVMRTQFSPAVRGFAVAAVLAAVMSTTAGLLLACSAAVTHDMLGGVLAGAGEGRRKAATIAVTWVLGLFAMACAYDPPKLITVFYSAAIGLLSASFFVPLTAGIWWKRANTAGGVASILAGAAVYLAVEFGSNAPNFSAVLFALAAGTAAMAAGGLLGPPSDPAVSEAVAALHRPTETEGRPARTASAAQHEEN